MTEKENKEDQTPAPESTSNTNSPRTTVVHSTTPPLTKKFAASGAAFVSVRVESPTNGIAMNDKNTRLITLVPAGSTTSEQRPATPNILKRKPNNTTVTLAPKRPMISTTYVTTLPSSTSNVDKIPSVDHHQNHLEHMDHSPLSLLAEEAARRTPSLNLSPSTTSDLPLDPKFIGGPIIAGKEQIDIRKSEIVCQQISEHKLNGPYVVLIAHSHREYRGHPIKAENFEGFKEDTDTMKRFPLRAWTDSAYHETQYVHLEIPKLGLHPVAIVTLKDENVLNLRFPVLSSDRNNHGHKKFGRLWEQLIFPYDKIKNAYSCWHITPIQIVAELRDPNKLKKPKRPDLIQAQAALPLPYRQNPADLAINGFPYDTTSDEESDHKSRLMMDIKREPLDMINESMMSNGHGSVDEMTKEQLMEGIMDNARQKCDLLRNGSPELLRWMYQQSLGELNGVRDHLNRERCISTSLYQHTFEHGSA